MHETIGVSIGSRGIGFRCEFMISVYFDLCITLWVMSNLEKKFNNIYKTKCLICVINTEL